MNKRNSLLLALILLIVVLAGLFVSKLEQERQIVKNETFSKAISEAQEAIIGVDYAPLAEKQDSSDIWTGLGILRRQLVADGEMPTFEMEESFDTMEGKVTYRGATYHEKRIEENGCAYAERSVIVNNKIVALPSVFAGGNSESCEKTVNLGTEVRSSFVGVTGDQKEAWIVESSPFPVGDSTSGEIGLGTDLLRVNLVTGKVTRWNAKDGFIQRTEPLTGKVLVHQPMSAGVSGYAVYDVFTGAYEKKSKQNIPHSEMNQVSDNEIVYHVVIQTAISDNGRYAAFAYIDFGISNALEKPMTLTIWNLETGEVRNIDTGLDKNAVFAISGWTEKEVNIIWRTYDMNNKASSNTKTIPLGIF